MVEDMDMDMKDTATVVKILLTLGFHSNYIHENRIHKMKIIHENRLHNLTHMHNSSPTDINHLNNKISTIVQNSV